MTEFDLVIVALLAGVLLACGLLGIALCVAAARGDRQMDRARRDVTERERHIARGPGGGFRH